MVVQRYVYWTQLSPDSVQAALRSSFAGTVRDGSFDLSRRRAGSKNSWRPSLRGTFYAAGGGTRLEVDVRLGAFILGFTLIHGLLLCGVSWLIALGAFYLGRAEMLDALWAVAQVELSGADAAAKDAGPTRVPTDAGAAAGAPGSFRVQAGLEAARFIVRSRTHERPLEVSARGLQFGAHRVDWDDLDTVFVDQRAIFLRRREGPSLTLDASRHSETDVDWLARYLAHRNRVRSATAADREGAAHALRQVGAAQRDDA